MESLVPFYTRRNAGFTRGGGEGCLCGERTEVETRIFRLCATRLHGPHRETTTPLPSETVVKIRVSGKMMVVRMPYNIHATILHLEWCY